MANYNYTPSDQIELQRKMSEALMGNDMRQGLSRGQKTDWGRGLAHMLKSYQGGKGLRDAAESEKMNTKATSSELNELLSIAGNTGETTDFSSMAVTDGMDQGTVQGAQANAIPEQTLGGFNATTPQGQELRAKLMGDELAYNRDMNKQSSGIDQRGGVQKDLANLNNDASMGRVIEGGNQTRITQDSAPYSIGPGMGRYKDDKLVAERGFKPSASIGSVGGAGSAKVLGRWYEVKDKAEGSRGKLQEISRLKDLNRKGSMAEGSLAPIMVGALGILESAPGFNSEMLSDSQQFESWVAGLTRADLDSLGAKGLTDQDMKIIARQYPQLGRSNEANAAILGVLERQQYSAIERFEEERQIMHAAGLGIHAPVPKWLSNVTDSDGFRAYKGASDLQSSEGEIMVDANGNRALVKDGVVVREL